MISERLEEPADNIGVMKYVGLGSLNVPPGPRRNIGFFGIAVSLNTLQFERVREGKGVAVALSRATNEQGVHQDIENSERHRHLLFAE